MSIFNVFSLLGGLAMFLYGMDVMGKSLEKQAGNRLQTILSRLTDNPLKGFLLGLVVTSIIQSSSATTVMVVGFVNSGLMQLHQAIGIIMGSNVGTTVTGWILSLSGIEGESFWIQLCKPSTFAPVLAFIGLILYMFVKNEKKKGIGAILLGFAILMTGMEVMSGAVSPLADDPQFTALFTAFSNPILGVLAGALLTGIIQSSSASVGILQALSSTGIITFGSAIPIIMGQNIGTCVTALISSIGANKNAKRAAMVHLYFNIIGVVVFLSLFYSLNAVFHFSFVNDTVNPIGIAIVHSIFNILATSLLLPFNRALERLAILTIPDDKKPETIQVLDDRLLATPALAVERARAVTVEMAGLARATLLQGMSLIHKWDKDLAEKITEGENRIDEYEDRLGTYLVRLSSRSLTMEDSHAISLLLHTIGDYERIGDHAVNLLDTAKEIHEKGLQFSESAQKDLAVLESAVQEVLDTTITGFEKSDLSLADQVQPLEQVIDDLVRELKNRHIQRLQSGECTIELGFVLSDLLTNYERVSDHCSNISVTLEEVAKDRFDTHEYLSKMKEGEGGDYRQRIEDYHRRFALPEMALEGKSTTA
nr:Na/Pi cotransporter family protein [uncultured Solibaculum sp.]